MIYKYPLRIVDLQEVMMPKNAKVLSVASQNGVLCLWALVDPSEEKETRIIEIIGTGNPVELMKVRTFIGTVVMDPFVWHVFERHLRISNGNLS